MLTDYITAYIKARKEKDTKEMSRIETHMARLGMDKMTLNMVATELEKG